MMNASSDELTSVRSLFGRSWAIYKKRGLSLMAALIMGMILAGIPLALVTGVLFFMGESLTDWAEAALVACGAVAVLFAASWGNAAFHIAVTDPKSRVLEAFRRARGLTIPSFWVGVLMAGIIVGGCFLVVPGVIFAVWFFFAQFVLAREDERGLDALLKSREYVSGKWLFTAFRLMLIWGVLPVGLGLVRMALQWAIPDPDAILPAGLPIILAAPLAPFLFIATNQLLDDLAAEAPEAIFEPTVRKKALIVLSGLLSPLVCVGILLTFFGGVFWMLVNDMVHVQGQNGAAASENSKPPALTFKIKKPPKTDQIRAHADILKDPSQGFLKRYIALSNLGKTGAPEAIGPIVEALDDDAALIRCNAALILGKIRAEQAREGLRRAVNDKGVLLKDEVVTNAVADASRAALAALDDPAARIDDGICIGADPASGDIDADIRILGNTGGDSIDRMMAATRLGWTKNNRAFDPLVQALSDEDASVRGEAVEGLILLDDPRALEAILPMLQSGADWRVRKSAAAALGHFGGSDALEALIHALGSDKNVLVRATIAEALGEIGDKRAAGPLEGALHDVETVSHTNAAGLVTVKRDAAEAAARALEALGEPVDEALLSMDPVEANILKLKNAKSEEERAGAARRLRMAKDNDKIIEPLIDSLVMDKSPRVRASAAATLGELGASQASPALDKALGDDDEAVRIAARNALKKMKPRVPTTPSPMLAAKPASPPIPEQISTVEPTRKIASSPPPATPAPDPASTPKIASSPPPATPAPDPAPTPKIASSPPPATPAPDPATTRGGVTKKRIFIGKQGFTPVEMNLRLGGRQRVTLTPKKPESILKEPLYKGPLQLYGQVSLGTMTRPFQFVFDRLDAPHSLLYFDLNRNGDLTDDGTPAVNKWDHVFGSSIYIPFKKLIKETEMKGAYRTWIYMKDSHVKKRIASRYSCTQLKGAIDLDGQTYTAYIADAGNHDADYTNDGITIDLDHNGAIDIRKEYFPPRQIARIGNHEYAFEIDY